MFPLTEPPRLVLALALLVTAGCSDTRPQMKNLTHEDPIVRRTAADALRQMGPDAGEAVPHLIEALADRDVTVQEASRRALASIGAAAVPGLIEALQDPEPETSNAALIANFAVAKILGSIGTPAVAGLIELLRDKDSRARSWSVIALRRIGPDAANAVPHLIGILANNDESETLRMDVAGALGDMGPDARAAVPSLIQALEDAASIRGPGADALRHYTAQALGQIGPDANLAIPALRKLLGHRSERVRTSAAVALAFISPDAGYGVDESKRLITVLGEALSSENSPEIHERIQQASDLLNRRVTESETTDLEAQVLELSLAVIEDSRMAALRILRTHNPPAEAISALCNVLQRENVAPPRDDQGLKVFAALVTGVLFVAVLNDHPDQDLEPLVADCVLGTAQLLDARGDIRRPPGNRQFALLVAMVANLLAENHPASIINFRGELGGSGGIPSGNMIELVYEWLATSPELDVGPLQEAFHEALADDSRPDRRFLCRLELLTEGEAQDFVNEACAERVGIRPHRWPPSHR